MMKFSLRSTSSVGNRIESYPTITAASGVDLAWQLIVHYARNQLVYLTMDLKAEKNRLVAREKAS